MITIWARRHALFCYVGVTYGVSWAGVLAILAASRFEIGTLAPGAYLAIFGAMVLGPSISGVAMTIALDGRAGLRRLWAGMTRWRAAPIWYAVALLTTPALLLPVLAVFSAAIGPAYHPQFQFELFAVGLLAGAFEEIGWTGFATPRLLERASAPFSGLTLGVVWTFWHAPADFAGNFATMGANWATWFAVFWVAALPPYRLLMTWLYQRTESVLLGALMHAGYTGWLFVLSPATTFEEGLLWQGAFAAMLWIAALAATLFTPRRAVHISARS